MKHTLTGLFSAAVLAIPLATSHAPGASAMVTGDTCRTPDKHGECKPNRDPHDKRDKCPTPRKFYKCNNGRDVPHRGSFQMHLVAGNAKITLQGVGTPSTAGTQIFLGKVTMRNVPRGGQAFKVFASKRMPSLRLVSKGKLYEFNPAANSWRPDQSISKSGVYAVVQ